MKKTSLKIVIFLLVIVEIVSLFFAYQSFQNSDANLHEFNYLNKSEIFAIMLEQPDGTYEEDTSISKWPSTGYIYNKEFSGCLDLSGNKVDGVLTYDEVNHIAEVNTIDSVSCYLYFDRLPVAYAIYSNTDNSLSFFKTKEEISVGDTYNDKLVTALYTGFEDNRYSIDSIPWKSHKYSIQKVEFIDEISPLSTAYWFESFENCNIFDLENLNTSNVTDMSHMFSDAGVNVTTLEIDASGFDTSNVENMSSMFSFAGNYSTTIKIDLSSLNTSKVTNMSKMFWGMGETATTWDIGDLSTETFTREDGTSYMAWDTSNVTDMSSMFSYTGGSASQYKLDLSNWDTSNVTNMSGMFYLSGYGATTWDIGDLSKKTLAREDGSSYVAWNTSNVENMSGMFYKAGENATYSLDLSGWDVTKVTSYNNFNSGVITKIIAPTFGT